MDVLDSIPVKINELKLFLSKLELENPGIHFDL